MERAHSPLSRGFKYAHSSWGESSNREEEKLSSSTLRILIRFEFQIRRARINSLFQIRNARASRFSDDADVITRWSRARPLWSLVVMMMMAWAQRALPSRHMDPSFRNEWELIECMDSKFGARIFGWGECAPKAFPTVPPFQYSICDVHKVMLNSFEMKINSNGRIALFIG